METLSTIGHARLASLCEALDLQPEAAADLFDVLSSTWGWRPATHTVPSSLTDDGTPFEFSVAFGGARPELRILVEAQGNQSTAMLNWHAARRLTVGLGRGVERAHRLAALFIPVGDDGPSIWHAVDVGSGAAKLYLDPTAGGREHVEATVAEALALLGHGGLHDWLREHVATRPGDRFVYVSIDLDDGPMSRTKIYVAHDGATPAEVERAMAAVRSHARGDALEICEALAPGRVRFDRRSLLTCYSIRPGELEPSSVTLHVPVRCYVESDAVAIAGARHLLSYVDGYACEMAAMAVAGRPLDARAGAVTYVSCRRVEGRRRTTVYLSAEATRTP